MKRRNKVSDLTRKGTTLCVILLAKKCPVSLVDDSTTILGLPSARSIRVVAGVLVYKRRAARAEMPTTVDKSR